MIIKTLYMFFYFAVAMFVAKPFIGFDIADSGIPLTGQHSLLAKSFTSRKPEDLEDAKHYSTSIHHRLSNPPLFAVITIACLLSSMFSLLFADAALLLSNLINRLKAALTPPEHLYLLTGKLTI